MGVRTGVLKKSDIMSGISIRIIESQRGVIFWVNVRLIHINTL